MAKPDAAVFRPAKELKGFAKVFLKAGESKTVTIPLDDKTFRYWNVATDHWEVEGGSYQLLVGANVQDIRLMVTVLLSPALRKTLAKPLRAGSCRITGPARSRTSRMRSLKTCWAVRCRRKPPPSTAP